jgi:hypothetical protein
MQKEMVNGMAGVSGIWVSADLHKVKKYQWQKCLILICEGEIRKRILNMPPERLIGGEGKIEGIVWL